MRYITAKRRSPNCGPLPQIQSPKGFLLVIATKTLTLKECWWNEHNDHKMKSQECFQTHHLYL